MDWKNLKPLNVVPKEWGTEYWLVNNSLYCCKILALKKGFQCSLHHHRTKDETFIVLSGHVRLERNGVVKDALPGERMHISPYARHRFGGIEDSEILEVSTHHSDDDVVRDAPSGKMDVKNG